MDKNEFKPPKLPIAWIAVTFIIPILTVILPYLFSAKDAPFATLVIIALSLLSVSLLIVCFALVVKLYNEAYMRQVMKLKVEQTLEQLEKLQKRLQQEPQQKRKQKPKHRR